MNRNPLRQLFRDALAACAAVILAGAIIFAMVLFDLAELYG